MAIPKVENDEIKKNVDPFHSVTDKQVQDNCAVTIR